MLPTKFLCHKNELVPINTQFSGIFNKSSRIFTQELPNRIPASSPQLNVSDGSSNSVSTVETIDYEFLTPHTKKISRVIPSSPNKELNLSEYFGKFLERPLLQNLDKKQVETLTKISKDVPPHGNLTFKTNSANELTKVVYYDTARSKLIDYNIMHPSAMGLVPNIVENVPFTPLVPSTSQHIIPVSAPLRRKVGRPRNDSKRPVEKEIDVFDEDELISHRTKSGRIVKLNPDIAKIFQIEQDVHTPVEPHVQIIKHIPEIEVNVQPPPVQLLPGLKEPPKKPRKISSEFRCKTCKKIYLGKNKMNHHFKLFPDHRQKAPENESVLFSHLMSLVRQKKRNHDQADVFFKELSNFVQHCEKLTPKLITNKDNPNTHHHIIDKNAASLLRINPGNYRLNMNVFDKNFKIDSPAIEEIQEEREPETILDNSDNNLDDHHDLEPEGIRNEVMMKVLDDVPSLDGNEVNLLTSLRQTNELTNLTNISDIVGEQSVIVDGDNALLGFLN